MINSYQNTEYHSCKAKIHTTGEGADEREYNIASQKLPEVEWSPPGKEKIKQIHNLKVTYIIGLISAKCFDFLTC